MLFSLLLVVLIFITIVIHSFSAVLIVLMMLLSFLCLQAGVKKWGTDEAAFIRVFTQRHLKQLSAMFSEYEKVRPFASTENPHLCHWYPVSV